MLKPMNDPFYPEAATDRTILYVFRFRNKRKQNALQKTMFRNRGVNVHIEFINKCDFSFTATDSNRVQVKKANQRGEKKNTKKN